MLKIGDFANLFSVTIKTVRFYEEKELLKPCYVDKYSGYRYYDDVNIKQMSKIIYLKELGFNEELITLMENNLPDLAVRRLQEERNTVMTNIKYLKDLGVTNYVEAFVKFYNMFLMDTASFDDIFSKYDIEDLVAKLEKNIAIMEYL